MNKIVGQQISHVLRLSQLLACSKCGLTEQRAKCQVIKVQKQKCVRTLCKKCIEANIDRNCNQIVKYRNNQVGKQVQKEGFPKDASNQNTKEGCTKKIKQHRYKYTNKQKLKSDITFRFELQSRFRERLSQQKYAQIDQDMSHILSALLIESNSSITGFQKQIDKLVAEIQDIKNTVQSQIGRGNLPILKQIIKKNQNKDCDAGVIACGFQQKCYDKGFVQLLKNFQ